jgi:aspartate/methionine/tyrosine aminotransferase
MPQFHESRRARAVTASHIPTVNALVREHPGTISLGQGVVHYGPPPEVLEGVHRFFQDPENHKYKAEVGISPLIAAFRAKLERENGFHGGDSSRVVVTAGSNMGFLNTVLAIADPGDEIILPVPYYFNHEMAVTMADCRPVLVPTGRDYQLRLDALENAITPRTKAILTVSPNNPTGVVYPEASLRGVNELCRRHGLFHISDEAYEYFVYGRARHFSPGSIPGSAGHTISLYTLSKTYGFASWRIGFMVIPAALHEAVKKIQETNLICPPVVSQFGALGALEAGAAFRQPKIEEFAQTREIVRRELAELGGLCDVSPSEGAIYLFLRLDTSLTPMAMIERLVREHGVAVMPGPDFGMNDGCYLRLSYGALPQAIAAEGVGRLVRGLKAILGEVT